MWISSYTSLSQEKKKKVVIYLPEGPELQPAFLMARAAFGGEFCTGKPRGNAKALDYTTSSQWGHWRDCRKRWVFSERSKLGLKRKTALHLGAGERLFSSNPPPNVADIWGGQWLPRSGMLANMHLKCIPAPSWAPMSLSGHWVMASPSTTGSCVPEVLQQFFLNASFRISALEDPWPRIHSCGPHYTNSELRKIWLMRCPELSKIRCTSPNLLWQLRSPFFNVHLHISSWTTQDLVFRQ